MIVPIGRRRLNLTLTVVPSPKKPVDVPVALGATDAELARIGSVDAERLRWEALAILHGYRR